MGAELKTGLMQATTLAALLACTGGAAAQTALPDINITDTRLTGIGSGEPPSGTIGGIAFGGAGITGASTTVITSEDIARSPNQTLPDILARQPGIQVTNAFGGVNGARSVVDMRGFGASASSNTLILVNGRRINDLDIASIDLAAIPRESIERIEITRGNSGAVLYGDGAVGGVINIVTKSGVGQKPTARIDGAFGSFNYREGNFSASGSNGGWSASVFGNAIRSDGYRDNNHYKQYNAVGDLRYIYDRGSFYVNLSADDQSLGLPGARRVQPDIGLNQLLTDRRGATTPFDFADKQGRSVTAGFTHLLAPGFELIVDGGVREKKQQAQFYNTFPAPTLDPTQGVDTTLTTASFTPRVKIDSLFGTMPFKAIGGVDYYNADYKSDRTQQLGASPINQYNLNQSSLAAYWQQTVNVLPGTDIAAGGRMQTTRIEARDAFDPNAPGGTSCFPPFGCFPNGTQGAPFDGQENNRAYHLGVEQRITQNVALFGRMTQSFRVPNVDERVGMAAVGATNFQLRTQKSHDIEGGVRMHFGALEAQWSIYDMRLTDEIHFRFAPGEFGNNVNLDPTRRYGHETIVAYRVNEAFRLKGGLAYTRAVFREGQFAGNNVPLVSKWTANGGFTWDIWQKYLTLDTVVRYASDRYMDNDQRNVQPLIPSATTVDVKIGGQYEQFFWSFAVLNLFDKLYFDYAIASPYPDQPGSTLGTYNAYPLPGRTFMLKAGMTW